MTPQEEKFWNQVQRTEGCWLWTSTKCRAGYGRFFDSGERYAHRFSWELANGPVPKGMCVCHRCDVPLCVRPDHLFLGTIADNNADKMAKQRHVRGQSVITARLLDADIPEIRVLLSAGEPRRQIASRFGVSKATIRDIALGVSWRHIPSALVPPRRGRFDGFGKP